MDLVQRFRLNRPSLKADAKRSGSPTDIFAARELQFVQSGNGSRTLVLGLNWRSILVNGGKQAALERARMSGGTHHCMVGTHTLGYGRLATNVLHSDLPPVTYPAAVLATRLGSSESLFALTLSPTEIWVAVIRNGKPYGLDEVLHIADESISSRAQNWLVSKMPTGSSSAIYSDIEHGLTEQHCEQCGFSNLMEIAANKQDELQLIASKPTEVLARIPKPLWYVAGAMALVWMGSAAYGTWQESEKASAAAAARVLEQQTLSPTALWQGSIKKAAAKRAQPEVKSVYDALQSLGKLRTDWDGWLLKEAKCYAKQAGIGKKVWSCVGTYQRADNSGAVTNRELAMNPPEGFHVQYKPFNEVLLDWSVSSDVTSLNLDKLLTREQHLVDTTSLLQTYKPTLTSITGMAFKSMAVDPPQSTDGALIPKPQNVLVPSESPLSISGPLRSVYALLDRGLDVDWTSVSLVYLADVPASASVSALQVTVAGVLYAKD